MFELNFVNTHYHNNFQGRSCIGLQKPMISSKASDVTSIKLIIINEFNYHKWLKCLINHICKNKSIAHMKYY